MDIWLDEPNQISIKQTEIHPYNGLFIIQPEKGVTH